MMSNKVYLKTSPFAKQSDLIFFVPYCICLIVSILSTTFFSKYFIEYYNKFVFICILALCFGEFLSGKYNIKDFISVAVSLLIAIFLVRYNYIYIYTIIFFIFFSRNIDFKKIAKASEIVSILTLIFVIFSAKLNIIENYVFDANMLRIREGLGFRYPLYSSYIFCNVVAMALCADREEFKWKKILFYFFINVWIFSRTNSRLSCIITIVLLLYAVYVKLNSDYANKHHFLYVAMIFSFVVLFGISVYVSIYYRPNVKLYAMINNILGGRFDLQHNAVMKYGITLLGQDIVLNGWGLDTNGNNLTGNFGHEYNYVDNAYIQLLIIRGIIFTIIVVAVFTYISYRSYKEKDYILLAVLATLAVRFFIDDLGLQLHYNTLWLAISPYIYSSKVKKTNLTKDKKNLSFVSIKDMSA